MVQEFVGNAHGDLNRVQELLQQEPALVNACWDWGGGDWETGLGDGRVRLPRITLISINHTDR